MKSTRARLATAYCVTIIAIVAFGFTDSGSLRTVELIALALSIGYALAILLTPRQCGHGVVSQGRFGIYWPWPVRCPRC